MKYILFFLLLLVPSTAFAGLAFDISCENVTNIAITRSVDPFLQKHAPDGLVHGVIFFLKPEARDAFQKFVDASRRAQLSRDAGGGHPHAALSITANGKPLRSDILEIRGYGGTKVCTFILLEEDAFDVARSVCPTIPIELIIPPQDARPRAMGIAE